MKKLLHINLKTILSLLFFTFILASCKDDEEIIPDLTLDKTSVEITVDEQGTVKIETGNGGYTVSSSSATIATAAISGTTITITGVAKGGATITVKDQSGKTATIAVTVNTAIIDATTPRFKWTNTIELEKTNGWGTTILTDRVAVTNLTDKKQFVLLWTGGFTAGEKTGAKLRIVESGNTTTEEVTLTALEVQKVDNNRYSIVFSKDTQKGELVFTK
ncbi:MAG: hypothetical protein AB2L24_09525 [Mangrovibacterium sp.]